MFLSRKIRSGIIRAVGKVLPDSDRLRSLGYGPMLATWRERHSGDYPILAERTEMYDFINREIIADKAMQYLEFGVWHGESIKYFAEINSHADSRFVGFDTFTGLPEQWVDVFRTVKSKECDAGGELPRCDDVRVSFVSGLFQDTLSDFLQGYRESGQLVINNDCDLYSATMYVLTRANDIIRPGTIVIFDEFYALMHEFRALEDYCSSYMRSYEVIAATLDHGRVAIRML